VTFYTISPIEKPDMKRMRVENRYLSNHIEDEKTGSRE